MFDLSVCRAARAASLPALCLMLAHAPACAQSPVVPASAVVPAVRQSMPTPTGAVVLPQGMPVHLALQAELKSGGSKEGQEVPFEVLRDVYGPLPAHLLLVPAGTPAFGKVTKSSRRGMLGKGGKLEFTCDYLKMTNGMHVPLRAEEVKARGRSNGGANVAAALLLAPGWLLINGRDISVHKGQEVSAYVDQDTRLTQGDASAPATLLAASSPVSPGKALFTLKTGEQVVGSMTAFDGVTYTVATEGGARTLAAADVKSIYALK